MKTKSSRGFTPEPGRFVNPLYPQPGVEPEYVELSYPSAAVGRFINLLYPDQAVLDKADDLHSAIRAQLKPVHELGMLIYDALVELAPLDAYAHDADLGASPDVPRWAAGTSQDRVGVRYKRAREKAESSLGSLRVALAEVEGILRGEDKDRYEEPVKRAVRGAEQLLDRLVELEERHEQEKQDSRKPYKIRQNKLSSVTVKCAEAAKQVEEARVGNSKIGIEQPVVAELQKLERRLFQVKRRLCRLRDNPSQKMTEELKSLARECDSIHLGFLVLIEEADPWRREPRSIREIRAGQTDSWSEVFVWNSPGRSVLKARHWHEKHSPQPGWLDFTSRCNNCYPRFLQSEQGGSSDEPDYVSLLLRDLSNQKQALECTAEESVVAA